MPPQYFRNFSLRIEYTILEIPKHVITSYLTKVCQQKLNPDHPEEKKVLTETLTRLDSENLHLICIKHGHYVQSNLNDSGMGQGNPETLHLEQERIKKTVEAASRQCIFNLVGYTKSRKQNTEQHKQE